GARDQTMRSDGRSRDLDGHVGAPRTLLLLSGIGIGADSQRLTGARALGVVSNAGPAGGHFVRNMRLELVGVVSARVVVHEAADVILADLDLVVGVATSGQGFDLGSGRAGHFERLANVLVVAGLDADHTEVDVASARIVASVERAVGVYRAAQREYYVNEVNGGIAVGVGAGGCSVTRPNAVGDADFEAQRRETAEQTSGISQFDVANDRKVGGIVELARLSSSRSSNADKCSSGGRRKQKLLHRSF